MRPFFRVYKQLPEGRKKVELNGFESAEVAKSEIKKAFDAYKAKQ
ncbi:inorganic diphosphatase [Pantoea tagorei]